MINKKLKSALFLAAYSCVSTAAEVNEAPANNNTKAAESNTTIQLDEIEIKAKRRRIITPLPGLPIDRETATTNIQSSTAKEISESKALNVTDFLNSNMQSVTVNDYAGNPFQQDLNFRGFTASPQIGTPQGISVYLDGVRINEPFGEVVNWDLIPMNAISTLNIIPGANPMFGLNTIGGALAITTKDGFSDHFLRAQYLTGDWGREQFQFSNGIHSERFALFTAYSHFDENGWRVNSPSNVRQLFNKATIRLDSGEVNFTALNVETALVGNGLLPVEMADFDRKQVFTSPDIAKNNLEHYNLSGTWYASDRLSFSANRYIRNLGQKATGTDIYGGFKAFYTRMQSTNDLDGDGCLDNDLNCDNIITDDVVGAMNGVLSLSSLNSKADGYSFQATYEGEKHQLAAGLSIDSTDIKFQQSQILAMLNSQNEAELATNPYFVENGLGVITTQPGVIRNRLTGSSKSKAIFFSDVWSPIDTLHASFGARMSWTNVKNYLVSDRGLDFYQFNDSVLLDPTRQICRVNPSDFRARFVCTEGDYDYRSFNPSVGLAWEAKESLTAYGNISKGSRVPSVIELGCAKDDSRQEGNSTNFQYGCSIPTSLTADPYLKQVRSVAYEAGLRGGQEGFDWNVGAFLTNLTDDILFVPLGQKNRGVFDNFGRTRREGIEMGFKSKLGKSSFGVNYTWMKATFQSPSQLINDANSSNTEVTTNQAYVNVNPGDQLPGMPNHILQASWNYQATPDFDFTLSAVAHSSSFVRGNENNAHEPRQAALVDLTGDGEPERDRYNFTGKGKIDGYAIFNLRANYRFNGGLSMFVKVDNLLDKQYATAGNLGRNPFTPSGSFKFDPVTVDSGWVNSTFIGPGAPRAAWVGLSFDWDWDKIKKSKSLQGQE